jgi:hypothetical protein
MKNLTLDEKRKIIQSWVMNLDEYSLDMLIKEYIDLEETEIEKSSKDED